MSDNPILLTDGYKPSHWLQDPPGTTFNEVYLGARFGDPVMFFGLQYQLRHYLGGQRITRARVEEAGDCFSAYYGSDAIFNYAGWKHIMTAHNGRLPLDIRAVAEGTIVPAGNALLTSRNTDPALPWLPGYFDPLLTQLWRPCSIAAMARRIKRTIASYLEATGTPALLPYKLHDFGFRSDASVESAAITGAAFLSIFQGSDTLPALPLLRQHYGAGWNVANSIPASEHATMTPWGRWNERQAFENMLNQFPTGFVAVVSDSYDIEYACRVLWASELRDRVMQRDGVVVVRPDSGEPVASVLGVLEALSGGFPPTPNAKGFKVLPSQIRVIQGDGLTEPKVGEILSAMMDRGWSADNVNFGMSLKKLDRDTHGFAAKRCSTVIDGEEQDVFKAPLGDISKASLRGRLKLVRTETGLRTLRVQERPDLPSLLEPVFLNGSLVRFQHIDGIRNRAELGDEDLERVGLAA